MLIALGKAVATLTVLAGSGYLLLLYGGDKRYPIETSWKGLVIALAVVWVVFLLSDDELSRPSKSAPTPEAAKPSDQASDS